MHLAMEESQGRQRVVLRMQEGKAREEVREKEKGQVVAALTWR